MSIKGKSIAYKRVSTVEQSTDRQLDGLKFDKVFEDKISGGTKARPALDDMLDFVREGDTITVHSIDRLARNLRHLLELIEEINQQGVELRFVKENLTFSGEPNPMQQLMLQVMGACAEFERAMILDRQREGIKVARAQGVKFGPKFKLSEGVREEIRTKFESGNHSQGSLAREYQVARYTIQNIIKGK